MSVVGLGDNRQRKAKERRERNKPLEMTDEEETSFQLNGSTWQKRTERTQGHNKLALTESVKLRWN